MAANPLRGEAVFEVGKIAYTLAYDINALVLAEEASGLDVSALLGELDRGASLKTLRAMIWAGLQKHHECHLIHAGELMSEVGIPAASAAMRKALAAALPKAKMAEGKPNPPKAADGTGSRGSRAGAPKG